MSAAGLRTTELGSSRLDTTGLGSTGLDGTETDSMKPGSADLGGTVVDGIEISVSGLLENFSAEVGSEDPVTVRGGGTQWQVGGLPSGDAREVKAPSGVWLFAPADMVVRCGAGTTVAELNEEIGRAGQMLPLDPLCPKEATVGGVLAVGRSGHRRLRYGPIRDLLLQVVFVNSLGKLIRSGGPTVKNVSGFDLCKLMVGSLGTLGFIAEVILRCQPVPETSQWFAGEASTPDIPAKLLAELWQPSSILWNGERVWVLLEGHPSDVAEQTASPAAKAAGLRECDKPPLLLMQHSASTASNSADTAQQQPPSNLPEPHPTSAAGNSADTADSLNGASVGASSSYESNSRSVSFEQTKTLLDGDKNNQRISLPPSNLKHLPKHFPPGSFLTEIGVGIVHLHPDQQVPADLLPQSDQRSLALQREIKARFDPTGRMNPGRSVWAD